jgi:hypothetical protein
VSGEELTRWIRDFEVGEVKFTVIYADERPDVDTDPVIALFRNDHDEPLFWFRPRSNEISLLDDINVIVWTGTRLSDVLDERASPVHRARRSIASPPLDHVDVVPQAAESATGGTSPESRAPRSDTCSRTEAPR